MANSLPKPLPPKLPEKIEDWTRYLKTERTINDLVEDIHRILVEEDGYRKYLYAVWDEQAIEGSLAADNIMAAAQIREYAKKNGSEIYKEKLATIVKALGVVLRRYHASRKQRRHRIGDEIVPNDDNGFE